jgi:hypothetical protein
VNALDIRVTARVYRNATVEWGRDVMSPGAAVRGRWPRILEEEEQEAWAYRAL